MKRCSSHSNFLSFSNIHRQTCSNTFKQSRVRHAHISHMSRVCPLKQREPDYTSAAEPSAFPTQLLVQRFPSTLVSRPFPTQLLVQRFLFALVPRPFPTQLLVQDQWQGSRSNPTVSGAWSRARYLTGVLALQLSCNVPFKVVSLMTSFIATIRILQAPRAVALFMCLRVVRCEHIMFSLSCASVITNTTSEHNTFCFDFHPTLQGRSQKLKLSKLNILCSDIVLVLTNTQNKLGILRSQHTAQVAFFFAPQIRTRRRSRCCADGPRSACSSAPRRLCCRRAQQQVRHHIIQRQVHVADCFCERAQLLKLDDNSRLFCSAQTRCTSRRARRC